MTCSRCGPRKARNKQITPTQNAGACDLYIVSVVKFPRFQRDNTNSKRYYQHMIAEHSPRANRLCGAKLRRFYDICKPPQKKVRSFVAL